MLRDGRAAAGNNAADWIRAIAERQTAPRSHRCSAYAPRIKAMLTRFGAAAMRPNGAGLYHGVAQGRYFDPDAPAPQPDFYHRRATCASTAARRRWANFTRL
jgi:hypothetical protein